jgi:predicted enzyme related to lactoylglutathione lyase
MAKNTVCHIEWEVSDLARAQAFYQGMFEWEFRAFGDSMVTFGTGDQHIGGLMKSDTPKPGNSPSVWIEVDDVEAMCLRATNLGGTVLVPKAPVEHVGWSALVADLDGNPVGMVQFARE